MSESSNSPGDPHEIQRLQESVAFLERRLDEQSAAIDDLSTRFDQVLKRVSLLERGAEQIRGSIEKISEPGQSGPGQSA